MPEDEGGHGRAALEREVVALRAQVLELQRAAARHEDTEGISLAEREELLREAERVAHLGTWAWDIESGRVIWSDEMYRILGVEPGSITPSVEEFFTRVHPEDRELAEAESVKGIRDGLFSPFDCRLVRPDGAVRHTIATGSFLFDQAGNPRRMVGGILDRTQILETEAELRRTLSLLEEAQHFAQLGSWRFDLSTGELEWSKEFRRIAGLPPDVKPSAELFFERIVPEDRERFRTGHLASLENPEGVASEIEGHVRRPDGEVRTVRLQGTILERADGIKEMRGTMLDTTDQERLREELSQAQKMEAVGRLAGGIAHDFNNLLTVVIGNLELLSDRVGGAPELDDSLQALNSATNLTRRLLAFGRKAPLSLKLMNPNEIVRSTRALMQRLVGDEIRLEIELAEDLPLVSVDPLEIERALVNLVVNARDVMRGGGVVRIATGCRKVENTVEVELSVTDHGPGIDEQDLLHIFEPFYTTRTDAGGTGLGLATVQGTVEQHGGRVVVQSSLEGGSTFTLVLPSAANGGEEKPQTAPPASSAKPESRLRFLVIDDEPKVADVTRRILEARGHRVHLASGPEDALTVWEEFGSAIDLVICDVVMTQMRGPRLISLLSEKRPTPRALFITGYSEEAVQAELEHPVLIKPFSAIQLWNAIHAALR